MTPTFKILKKQPLEVEITVDGKTKNVVYPDSLTEEQVLKAIKYEMSEMSSPALPKPFFDTAPLSKPIEIKEQNQPKPIKYNTVLIPTEAVSKI